MKYSKFQVRKIQHRNINDNPLLMWHVKLINKKRCMNKCNKELKRNNPTFTTHNLKVCYDLCIAEELLKIPVDILLKNMLRS